MKILSTHSFLLYICIIWGFLSCANQVYSLSYKDVIQNEITYNNVSSNQISESRLLERYINRYKKNISERYGALGKEDSKTIQDTYTILDLMDNALDKIQKGYVNGTQIESLMKSIVVDVKFLNTRVKIYMEQEEIIYQREVLVMQEKYSIVTRKIAQTLDSLIDVLTKGLINKSRYTQNEKNIVRVLIALRDNSSSLKAFGSIEFSKKSEIKPYISNIVQSVQGNIKDLKRLSR